MSGIGILLSGCNLAANRTKAGLQVFSKPASNLYINGKLVGLTPFLDHQLQAGYYQLKVATESASWSAKVKLTPGTITIVNRQFLPSVLGGEVLHLEKGDDLAVVSTPNGADLVIDNKLVGKSPLVYKEISPGEHRLIVSAPGFQSRSIVFQIHKG
ncbi:MAG: PEGA domain-containing protein, partial [Nitrososphaerota archaeon]